MKHYESKVIQQTNEIHPALVPLLVGAVSLSFILTLFLIYLFFLRNDRVIQDCNSSMLSDAERGILVEGSDRAGEELVWAVTNHGEDHELIAMIRSVGEYYLVTTADTPIGLLLEKHIEPFMSRRMVILSCALATESEALRAHMKGPCSRD